MESNKREKSLEELNSNFNKLEKELKKLEYVDKLTNKINSLK